MKLDCLALVAADDTLLCLKNFTNQSELDIQYHIFMSLDFVDHYLEEDPNRLYLGRVFQMEQMQIYCQRTPSKQNIIAIVNASFAENISDLQMIKVFDCFWENWVKFVVCNPFYTLKSAYEENNPKFDNALDTIELTMKMEAL